MDKQPSTKPDPQPETKVDQTIYLLHPTMRLKIHYWRGRVTDLMIECLGYIEITKEEFESEDV